MSMQQGPSTSRGRLRFGPRAYWRQTARLQGTWQAVGRSEEIGSALKRNDDLPLLALEFDAYRNVVAIDPSGERLSTHGWFLKNQYIWLRWNAKANDHDQRGEVPLQFQDQLLYIAWPPWAQNEGYLVLQRKDEQ